MGSQLIEAAYEYLALGLSVIALSGKLPNGKVHRHGLNSAFTPDHQYVPETDVSVEGAMLAQGTTGIGILTGNPVYHVVDIDGEDGARAWKEIAGDEFMPDRWVARTRHGLHLWYADIKPWPTTKLADRLDFKGAGGYVAAPPSAFGPCNDDPCERPHSQFDTYAWLKPPSAEPPPMEYPKGLMDHLTAAQFGRERRRAKKTERLNYKETGLLTNNPSYGGIIERMKAAQPGERNNVLNWAAYTILTDGGGDDELQQLAEVALATGMPKYEVVRTINSALDGAK